MKYFTTLAVLMTANVYSAHTGCHLRSAPAPAPAPVAQESPALATEGVPDPVEAEIPVTTDVYGDAPTPAPYAEESPAETDIYATPPVEDEDMEDLADGPTPAPAPVPAPAPAQQEDPVDELVDDAPPNLATEMEQRTPPRRSINTPVLSD